MGDYMIFLMQRSGFVANRMVFCLLTTKNEANSIWLGRMKFSLLPNHLFRELISFVMEQFNVYGTRLLEVQIQIWLCRFM